MFKWLLKIFGYNTTMSKDIGLNFDGTEPEVKKTIEEKEHAVDRAIKAVQKPKLKSKMKTAAAPSAPKYSKDEALKRVQARRDRRSTTETYHSNHVNDDYVAPRDTSSNSYTPSYSDTSSYGGSSYSGGSCGGSSYSSDSGSSSSDSCSF